MKSLVAITKCPSYEQGQVYASIKSALEMIDGLSFARPGSRILLKPNLLSSYRPEDGVTTHPSVIEAVVRLLKEFNVDIYIGDSPGIETVKTFSNYERVLKATGISDIAKKYGVKCLQFKETVLLPRKENHLFKELGVAREVLEMDAVINLPKLKTHVQMYLTLCVKNMFGCIVGAQKAGWHLIAGTDYIYFARMLAELYSAVKPALNILDGVVGMEGDGPASGKLRNVGLIIASPDGVALDRVVSEIVGADLSLFFTLTAAREIGCGESELSNIDILGEDLSRVKIKDFKFPEFIKVSSMGPKIIRKYLRSWVSARPIQSGNLCKSCGVCDAICPAKAINRENTKVNFDYDKCISCFCCAELCKFAAIKVHRPLLAKFLNRI